MTKTEYSVSLIRKNRKEYTKFVIGIDSCKYELESVLHHLDAELILESSVARHYLLNTLTTYRGGRFLGNTN